MNEDENYYGVDTTNYKDELTLDETEDHYSDFSGDDNPEEEQQQIKAELSSWDKKFIKIRQKQDLTEKDLKNMASLSDIFLKTAASYCRVIVEERHIPDAQKHIPPKDTGGIAGGTKFSVHGLFFKYSVDTQFKDGTYLYGVSKANNILARKAAGHDLKGLSNFVIFADQIAKSKGKDVIFNVPLFALIDYLSFRLSVMTELPLNSESLVYGSGDGGNTMHWREDIHSRLVEIAQELNLRPHKVTKDAVDSAFCGDLEIHKIDDMYFALDLARIFPPAPRPVSCSPSVIFYRMLRPELVKQSPKSLSSDAYSRWQSSDPKSDEMNKDIDKIQSLIDQIITQFKTEMQQKPASTIERYVKPSLLSVKIPNFSSSAIQDDIIVELHRRGINIRYIGKLLLQLDSSLRIQRDIMGYILSLMMVRVLKNRWRDSISKEAEYHSVNKGSKRSVSVYEICLKKTLLTLNSIPASTYRAEDPFWEQISSELWKTFIQGIVSLSLPDFSKFLEPLQDHVNFPWIIIRFCQLCGIVLPSNTVENIIKEVDFQKSSIDIVDFQPIIKTLPILDYYSALYYCNIAKNTTSSGSKKKYWSIAADKFESIQSSLFPQIREQFTSAQFEKMKYDKNYFPDPDFFIKSCQNTLFKLWNDPPLLQSHKRDAISISIIDDIFNKKSVDLLKKYPFRLNCKSDKILTPLYAATRSNSPDIVQYLLTSPGIDVNLKVTGGSTALHTASWNGFSNIVSLLLSAGADVNIKNDRDESAESSNTNPAEVKKVWDTFKNGGTQGLKKEKYPVIEPDQIQQEDIKLSYSPEYVKIYLDFLLAVLWKYQFRLKENLDPKNYRNISVSQIILKEKIEYLKKKLSPSSLKFFNLLPFRNQCMVVGYTDSGDLDNTKMVYNHFNYKARVLADNYEVNIIPSRYDNPNVWILNQLCTTNPDFVMQLLEEALYWDIEPIWKQWFFSNYFSPSDLLQLCYNCKAFHLVNLITSKPLLDTMFSNYPLFLQLYPLVSDNILTEIINTKDETGNNPFHKFMATSFEENISEELMKIYVAIGANCMMLNGDNKYALSIAQDKNMKALLTKLRSAGIDDLMKDRRTRYKR